MFLYRAASRVHLWLLHCTIPATQPSLLSQHPDDLSTLQVPAPTLVLGQMSALAQELALVLAQELVVVSVQALGQALVLVPVQAQVSVLGQVQARDLVPSSGPDQVLVPVQAQVSVLGQELARDLVPSSGPAACQAASGPVL